MRELSRRTSKIRRARFLILLWVLAVLTMLLACRQVTWREPAIVTEIALRVQQTQLAGTSTSLSNPPDFQSTYLIPTPGQFNSGQMNTATQSVLTPVAAGGGLDQDIPNFERRRKAARILLFENMSASGYVRYVQEALEAGDYFYLDVGSATGWFKDQLQSPVEWDLIIAAAEARRDFGGELFELINQRLESGAAAIVENWDLDLAPNGKAGDLLANCGLVLGSDWYEPQLRVFFWLVPDHPVFHKPNEIPSFTNASWLWRGDIGDLLDIRSQAGQPGGDAILLAGTNPDNTDQHGTLAICLQDRLILQTFSSHEYLSHDMIRLWQNYIFRALQGRFSSQEDSSIPTPWSVGAASFPTMAQGSGTPTPGGTGTCQGILAGGLTRPGQTQRQLFEHNAAGEFVILDLKVTNLSEGFIQIWDDDYRLEGLLGGKPVSYPIQKAATGYLFIEKPKNLWQDLLFPGQAFETKVVFDVDPQGEGWILNLSPGLEVNEQICTLKIPVS